MAVINVRPDKLDEIAAKLSSLSSDMDEQGNKLRDVESSVEAAWKSNYTGLYLNEVGVVKRNIEILSQKTQEIARTLRETAERVRRVEEENRRTFSQN